MLKVMVLAVAIWLLLLSSCESNSVAKRGRMRLCGQMLTETLHLVCGGQYYDPDENSVSKREAIPHPRADFIQDWFFGLPFPRFQQPRFNRRQVEGVANECCLHACSLSDLLAYCRVD